METIKAFRVRISLILSMGSWGGVYINWGYSKRICLGWFAITMIPVDFDILMKDLLKRQKEIEESAMQGRTK